jgi:hypothetical protein
MDYFRSYKLPADAGVVAAWESETARAKDIPSLARLIAERGAELYPEFAKRYAEVRALPRNARRALQRRLAASRDLAAIPSEWQRRLAYSIAGAALLLVLSDGPLQAGTINVGPNCALTDAILSANSGSNSGGCTGATPSPNTIVIPAKSKIVLTSAYPGAYNPTGLPTVTSAITITGNGASISRSKKGPQMRLMVVSGPGGDLTLNNLTLSGGLVPNGIGGAVYNHNGILEINNCIISGNTAYSGAVASIGTTTISGTTFTKNIAYNGGAVYNQGETDIHNSTITGNRALIAGGGLSNAYGQMSVQNSTLSKNSAYYAGGGIANYSGNVTVDPTIITGNKAALGGGIANAYGYVHVDHSTVSKNSAAAGGGIASVGGDGLTHGDVATVTVGNSSLITGNKSATLGGGVFNCGYFNLNDSTISGNSAKAAGGGIASVKGYHIGYYCFYNNNYNGNFHITGNKAKVGPNYFYY